MSSLFSFCMTRDSEVQSETAAEERQKERLTEANETRQESWRTRVVGKKGGREAGNIFSPKTRIKKNKTTRLEESRG